MAITTINTMLVKHSKILFGIFTIIIIVSFVWFFTPGTSGSIFFDGNPSSRNAVAGTVFQEKITRGDLLDGIRDMSLVMSAGYGVKPGSGMAEDMVRDSAFEMASRLKVARIMGVGVSEEQVGEYLRKLPAFRGKDGNFDPEAFKNYEKNALVPAGYTAKDLDNAVRNFLSVAEIERSVGGNVVVTPSEIENYQRMFKEKYNVKGVVFDFTDFRKQVKPTEQQLKDFHKANAAKYQSLPNYKAKVVRFHYGDFAKNFVPSAEAVKEYYDANKSEFTGKDGKTVEPLAKVSAKIKTRLTREESIREAMNAARTFREKLYNKTSDVGADAETQLNVFDTLAASEKLKPMETGWFASNASAVNNVGREPKVVSAIAGLAKRSIITGTIQGERAAFIAVRTGVQPPRVLTWKEAAPRVRADYIAQTSVKLAKEAAADFAAKMAASKNPAGDFNRLSKGARITTYPEFTFEKPAEKASQELLMLSEETRPGKLSRSQEQPDGMLFVFVNSRIQPSKQEMEKDIATAKEFLRMRKQFAVSDSLRTWIAAHTKSYMAKQQN